MPDDTRTTSRRTRQLAVLKLVLGAALVGVVGGLTFEIGRYAARSETATSALGESVECDDESDS